MSAHLFPLRLNLWEEFFVVDDHGNYPANFMTRIRCSGTLSRELLDQALKECVGRHPLFGCLVSRTGRRLEWELADEMPMPVEYGGQWESGEPHLRLPKKFDLFSELPWRIEVQPFCDERGRQKTDILLEVHHAVCDGLGAIQFLSDVAQTIDARHRGQRESLPGLDSQALISRGRFSQTWREVFRGLPLHYQSVLASLRMMFTRIDALVPVDSTEELLQRSKSSLGYHRILLSSGASSGLRRRARQRNSTVNSLVAAQLFQTLSQWQLREGQTGKGSLRIMMPFNERDLSDRRLPACNRVSLSPFTRTRSQIQDFDRLLQSIDRGVRAIKKGRLGLNFHRGLRACKACFGSLKTLARTDRVGATALFSNVGNLHAHLALRFAKNGTECGPLWMEDIDLVPPLRIGTSFAMTLHEFNGQTRLGIHYDSAMLPAEQASSFFGLLEEQIVEKSCIS